MTAEPAKEQSSARTATLRLQLVETLRARGALSDEAVAAAFRAVPRETFVPGMPPEQVYRDEAIVTKQEGGVAVSSSSQPAIMAIMLEQLDVRPGMQILEIGAGTGYNAALLQHLTGERGRVVTLDIDSEVAAWARARLDAAGYREVAVVQADGAEGYPGLAPYDRIVLTVGTADIAPAWTEQLSEGGLLLLPLWLNTAQISIAFEKRDGVLRSRSIQPCGFMRIRGRLAGRDRFVSLMPGVTLGTSRDDLPLDLLRELLRQPPHREAWPEFAGASYSDFAFFASLWDDAALTIGVEPGAEAAMGFSGGRFGYLVPENASLSLVPVFTGDGAPTDSDALSYGGEAARDRLRAAFERWRALGSPAVRDLEIAVYPLDAAPQPSPDQAAVDTRWWRLIISRPGGAVR